MQEDQNKPDMKNSENSKMPTPQSYTYSNAGIDITHTDTLKTEMSTYITTSHPRVLNGLGPFASLYDFKFDNITHPVLVLKTEEPGSKQKLAMEYGYAESICHDMINHLVNDIIVMGATPLAVLDTIVCGSADQNTIKSIIKGISDACAENECSLVGGETSVQPGIVENGTYILTSSIAGVIDKENIIDGTQISRGDIVLAVASNGLHTNGYTLVRLLMDTKPQIKDDKIDGETFIDAIMKPHTAYYKTTKDLAAAHKVKGMAHITGGGIEGNLKRIIPDGLCAKIDLSKIITLPIFRYIKRIGNIEDSEMLNTFNCGVGLILVVSPTNADFVTEHVLRSFNCYAIGEITNDSDKIIFGKNITW